MKFVSKNILIGKASDQDEYGLFRGMTLVTRFTGEDIAKIAEVIKKKAKKIGDNDTVSFDLSGECWLFEEDVKDVEQRLIHHDMSIESLLDGFRDQAHEKGLNFYKINVSPYGTFISSSFKWVDGVMEHDDFVSNSEFPTVEKKETFLSKLKITATLEDDAMYAMAENIKKETLFSSSLLSQGDDPIGSASFVVRVKEMLLSLDELAMREEIFSTEDIDIFKKYLVKAKKSKAEILVISAT